MSEKKIKRRSDYGKKRVSLHKCSNCSYAHPSNRTVKTHYLFNHASEEERKKEYKYYCDKCLYGSMTVHGWEKHLETKKHKIMLDLIRSLSSHG